jgi:uncharacterized protein YceH (UPF0502 family)
MEREPALVAVLPRQPGTKESRYAHLLSGPVETATALAAEPRLARREAGDDAPDEERIAQLEAVVAELRQEITALRRRFDDLFGDG